MAKIFISHSSKEKTITEQMATLFSTGLGIHTDDIFCTSLEGQGVRPGTIDTEEIKRELKNCQVAILLVSTAFRDSCYCNYELGALWITEIPLYVLLIPPWTVQKVKNENRLNWLLSNRQMAEVCNETHWDIIRDSLTTDLALRSVSTASWQKNKKAFTNWARLRCQASALPPRTSAVGVVPDIDYRTVPELPPRRSLLKRTENRW